MNSQTTKLCGTYPKQHNFKTKTWPDRYITKMRGTNKTP